MKKHVSLSLMALVLAAGASPAAPRGEEAVECESYDPVIGDISSPAWTCVGGSPPQAQAQVYIDVSFECSDDDYEDCNAYLFVTGNGGQPLSRVLNGYCGETYNQPWVYTSAPTTPGTGFELRVDLGTHFQDAFGSDWIEGQDPCP